MITIMAMTKNIKILLLASLFCAGFSACNTATPEDYFGRAVLASNMLTGFADDGMERQLQSPSAKTAANGEAVAMTRTEELDGRIQVIEEDHEKLKGLKQTDDAKEIMQNSLSLYDYVLPVYKKEYRELAASYDKAAPREQTQAAAQAIHDKYFEGFKERYDKLIRSGKAYAAKHNIKVNWAE